MDKGGAKTKGGTPGPRGVWTLKTGFIRTTLSKSRPNNSIDQKLQIIINRHIPSKFINHPI